MINVINANANDGIENNYIQECLIEPLKPRLFQFKSEVQRSRTASKPKIDNDSKDWKPVLSYKKLYQQPKFIMSMQRKKARIISAIRDRQIDENQNKLLGPIGGKVKNYHFMAPFTKTTVKTNFDVQSFVEGNQSMLKNQFKKKKNPKMNFSLLYMTERKKNIESQHRKKPSSARFTTTASREKGSDTPYLHMIMKQQLAQKRQRSRPQTSCILDNRRRTERPMSQIL